MEIVNGKVFNIRFTKFMAKSMIISHYIMMSIWPNIQRDIPKIENSCKWHETWNIHTQRKTWSLANHIILTWWKLALICFNDYCIRMDLIFTIHHTQIEIYGPNSMRIVDCWWILICEYVTILVLFMKMYQREISNESNKHIKLKSIWLIDYLFMDCSRIEAIGTTKHNRTHSYAPCTWDPDVIAKYVSFWFQCSK